MFICTFILSIYIFFYLSEVFKARDRNNKKTMVAMKKVLMENEKEGVSNEMRYIEQQFLIFFK